MSTFSTSFILLLVLSLQVFTFNPLVAATHYVDLNSPTPVPPYTNWDTAATTIQAAIDAAMAGDTILVTNGVYATGGRTYYGALTNRVVIDRAVAVRSVNGPGVTAILGQGPIGDNAVRCVYVGTNAVLEGFTLTNGATRASGDNTQERSGGGVWCETSGIVSNCTLAGNSAGYAGGGAYQGKLSHCTLVGNSGPTFGGGASAGTLKNCRLLGNAGFWGGGMYEGGMYDCLLSDNSAYSGGGANDTELNNCTVVGNEAISNGGGADGGILNNCIIYYNSAAIGANWFGSTLRYCCTTPSPGTGGNTTNEPKLASMSHLSGLSPCIGKGSVTYISGRDIDGESWRSPPSIGCDEFHTGAVTGAMQVAIEMPYPNVAVGVSVPMLARIEGRVSSSAWSFGDGTTTSNRPFAAHAWGVTGVFDVVLTARNESFPAGILITGRVQVSEQHIWHVAMSNAAAAPPYDTWSNAAARIQDAVDACDQAGGLVLVSNGVYDTGGRAVYGAMTNRVVLSKPVTVRSENGPGVTEIRGRGPVGASAVRCAYVGSGALLTGFTLTNGATLFSGSPQLELSGGGLWCELGGVISNCLVVGNSAAVEGGGTYHGTLRNCTLAGNRAYRGGGAHMGTLDNCYLTDNATTSEGGAVAWSVLSNCALAMNTSKRGGGSAQSTLNNCTLTGNSAHEQGGGSYYDKLNNCIVYYNNALEGPNWFRSDFLHSSTTPNPGTAGCIELEPELANASHLSGLSPCIGTGSGTYASGTDIDGELWKNPPSMGCDEVHGSAVTGALQVAIGIPYTNLSKGLSIPLTARIEGAASRSAWNFGDGATRSNRPYTSYAWGSTGEYDVVLTAWNDSYPGGVSDTVHVQVLERQIRYVVMSNTAAAHPYDSWSNAAARIQDAVDACEQVGGLVMVGNGVYDTGGRAVFSTMTNRVALFKPVTVRSVNGPGVTVIRGRSPWGINAVRCAYVANGAMLAGFTLTNGSTRYIGDQFREQAGGGAWCEQGGVISNCIIAGNSAPGSGGGVYEGTLYNCKLIGNFAGLAAGVNGSGGGAYLSTLNDCQVLGNFAVNGGGTVANGRVLTNCRLVGNSAHYGGGARSGTLYDCELSGNSAVLEGGGMAHGTLINCTVAGNSASNGGGTFQSGLRNSILYFNTATNGANYSTNFSPEITYSCTTPHPGGDGNTTVPPQFVNAAGGNYRLDATSPCLDRGINEAWMFGAPDLNGNPRILNGTVDLGAYEFHFDADLRALLQGAYATNAHAMTAGLAAVLPTNSPYAVGAPAATNIPADVTDWVVVQFHRDLTNPPAFARSMFLRRDGSIVGVDGATNVLVEVSPGTTNYLALAHRNHLTVISAPIAFTNRVITYDFTTGPEQFQGGTNACVELAPGVWGMIAGDCDGDGRITDVDRQIVSNQLGKTGYLSGDVNLDGVVTAEDVP